jgi:hypothetical protein
MTTKDDVSRVHRALIKNPTYRAYLTATDDEHAVEGSLADDTYFAAQMIRDKALQMGLNEVGLQKTWPIAEILLEVAGLQARRAALEAANLEAQMERLRRSGLRPS